MILTLFGHGNSYLVLNYSLNIDKVNNYLLKLSIGNESVIITRKKLNFAKKITQLFIKLGYNLSLQRHLCLIDTDTAIYIRQNIKPLKQHIPIEISYNSISKPPFLKSSTGQGCFFEENAHNYHKFKKILTSHNIIPQNYYHLSVELKIKCGLDDFSGYPNLFTIRNTIKHINSKTPISFNPTILLNGTLTNVKQQILLMCNSINNKFLKVTINGLPVCNNEIKNNKLILDVITNNITLSNRLLTNIVKIQAFSAGQQFIAHSLSLLLDIFNKSAGYSCDSWKIYYLQGYKTFNISFTDLTDNPSALQIENYKKGLLLIKILILHLIANEHYHLINCLKYFPKILSFNNIKNITYLPLVKLRNYLEKYLKKGYPNKSIQRLKPFKCLYKQYQHVKQAIIWLQNFFLGRTMMDCSLFYSIIYYNSGNNFISSYDMDECNIYNHLASELGYTEINNKLVKMSLVDLDMKSYNKISKWANDASIAIKQYNSNDLIKNILFCHTRI